MNLFPTKLPPSLIRPDGYQPIRRETETQHCLSSPVDQTEYSNAESDPQMHVDTEVLVPKEQQEETLTSVVAVPPAEPQPKPLICRNIFQIPLVLIIGFGFMYIRGWV